MKLVLTFIPPTLDYSEITLTGHDCLVFPINIKFAKKS